MGRKEGKGGIMDMNSGSLIFSARNKMDWEIGEGTSDGKMRLRFSFSCRTNTFGAMNIDHIFLSGGGFLKGETQ